jgi:agmatinase
MKVWLLGIPYDASSSYLRGAAEAPARIRQALVCASSNLSAEDGTDLGADGRWGDAGDAALSNDRSGYWAVEPACAAILTGEHRLLALGGDHAITYPVVRAHAACHPRLAVLHIDAHPDLYDAFDGDRYSHGSPFARICEERLAARMVQVGIRAATPEQRAQAQRFGVETIEMRQLPLSGSLKFSDPIYLSIDLDGLDPAFAPGVSHPEPGGLGVRDLLGLIQTVEGRVIGADIVELNPARDPQGITAMVAAKIVKELIARMLRDGG